MLESLATASLLVLVQAEAMPGFASSCRKKLYGAAGTILDYPTVCDSVAVQVADYDKCSEYSADCSLWGTSSVAT